MSDVCIEHDADFIVLRHHLDAFPSTLSGYESDLSSALEQLPLHNHDSFVDGSSAESDTSCTREHGRKPRSCSSQYPTTSYDDASAFISRFISCPVKENDAQLSLLRALIIELGLRSPNASDIPSTLTSARKILKAEAHVNVKEYVAIRHKGQSAIRKILKPSKSALLKDIRKGNGASLQWVKEHGLQVLLVTCFT